MKTNPACQTCLEPCDRYIYSPQLSYAALSEQLQHELISPEEFNGKGSELTLRDKFLRAKDVQDHVKRDYVHDLEVFQNITSTYLVIDR